MIFDFDPQKSASNLKKHGIDFIEAQKLWNDSNALKDIPDTCKEGEEYWLAVGEISGKIWSVIYNKRKGAIRLVSVRPARDYEKEQYEILKD